MPVVLILNISDKQEEEKNANTWFTNPKIKVIDFLHRTAWRLLAAHDIVWS